MHTPVPSAFGDLGIAWREDERGLRVYRILLPDERDSTGGVASPPPAALTNLVERMRRFLAGEVVGFEQCHLDLLALDGCPVFQQRVLLAEYGIPRGRVSTYGRIAAHLGVPGGARAVGNALARNPFPIVIPCHRAVHSDGRLGGYRGGLAMKRTLLEMEGVPISPTGQVLTDRFYY